MKRLIEQTACEHGNYEPECALTICPNDEIGHIHSWKLGCFCPGGSSREVTVDYEAALLALSESNPPKVPPFYGMDEMAREVVDAALGGGR